MNNEIEQNIFGSVASAVEKYLNSKLTGVIDKDLVTKETLNFYLSHQKYLVTIQCHVSFYLHCLALRTMMQLYVLLKKIYYI